MLVSSRILCLLFCRRQSTASAIEPGSFPNAEGSEPEVTLASYIPLPVLFYILFPSLVITSLSFDLLFVPFVSSRPSTTSLT